MADEKIHVFSNAVKETLRIWPVLTLARQHGFGGSDMQIKENWLVDSIIQIFEDNGKKTNFPTSILWWWSRLILTQCLILWCLEPFYNISS